MWRKRRRRTRANHQDAYARARDSERLFLHFVAAEVAWLEGLLSERGYDGMVYFPWGRVTVSFLLANLGTKLLERTR